MLKCACRALACIAVDAQCSTRIACAGGVEPVLAAMRPPTPPRTKWTRRVPHPVPIGHAASLTPYQSDTPRLSPRTNRTRRVTHPVPIGHAASLTPYQSDTPRTSVLPASEEVHKFGAGALAILCGALKSLHGSAGDGEAWRRVAQAGGPALVFRSTYPRLARAAGGGRRALAHCCWSMSSSERGHGRSSSTTGARCSRRSARSGSPTAPRASWGVASRARGWVGVGLSSVRTG